MQLIAEMAMCQAKQKYCLWNYYNQNQNRNSDSRFGIRIQGELKETEYRQLPPRPEILISLEL